MRIAHGAQFARATHDLDDPEDGRDGWDLVKHDGTVFRATALERAESVQGAEVLIDVAMTSRKCDVATYVCLNPSRRRLLLQKDPRVSTQSIDTCASDADTS